MSSIRRLNRIFRSDGRTLIVALDHALTEGPVRGLEAPAHILDEIVAGGADAVLTTYGVAMRFARELASLGLILRLDMGGTKLGQMGPGVPMFGVDDALRVAADAAAVSAFPGTPQESATLQMLADAIRKGHAAGLPVMAEVQPGGFDAGPEVSNVETIALSVRVAAELGADWVKAPYAPGFERVIQAAYVPVVMLGGVRVNEQARLFESVSAAVKAGAAGVAIGRNIFQADAPRAVVTALAAILHRGADAKAALEIYMATRDGQQTE